MVWPPALRAGGFGDLGWRLATVDERVMKTGDRLHRYRSVMPALPVTPGRSPIDEMTLETAAAELAARDPDLAAILDRHGPPPLWDREPGFATLVAIILEQQVSLRSGAAALARLDRAAGGLTPVLVAGLGEEGAREAGLTRQKARYVVGLADRVADGRLDPDALHTATDDEVRARLVDIPGIGRWTADIYLLMALGRPDVWPEGDLALATALGRAKGLLRVPNSMEQRGIAEAWRPWRAVAARILWHAYLAGER
jgi:DNA-3-methyladenine glycosylase II